ncbi:MAG: SPOR domain-containing protein [Sphingomonas sp.]|uniref:SPOR domain-containing protein n=1 Tax=Sphingomonas sp. TaxID=28214 RepID=UPI0025F48334|nr:SPOR domain-containing protein [Sphingomonas sp.]MBX3565107.1 SPOR domain-containing protein [Sphingomonas sp.]
MKSLWLAAAALAALLATPALAQDASVKAGVDAWDKGDYKGAVDLWRASANKGNADAQFNLGQAYKLGRGVPADLKQAEVWYGKAAWQGHEQAEASYGLALFANGKRSEALTWLQRAVQRGDPRAQYVLGTMYFNGDVVAKDWVRAYALVTRSSQTGLNEASSALAQMDKYMSLAERQQGLTLARKYEEEFNRAPNIDLPPPQMASNDPPVTAAPRPAPRPTPVAVTRPPVAKPPVTTVAVATPARDGGWRLQLGAFGDPNNARKLWGQVGSRFPGRQVYYVKQGNLTRVLVGPFASRGEAAGSCGGVSPCVPVSK